MKKCFVTKKSCLPDSHSAKKVANKFSKNSVNPLRAYRCQFCQFWHLTNKKDRW